MKVKRLIFNICLMVLAFCATASMVVYAKYYNFSNNTPTANDQNTANTATESEESKLLNNLVSTIMTADKLSGTVYINGTGSTNIEGSIYYDASKSATLYADIVGTYNKKKINLTAGLINDELYLSYEGVKFKINTTNAFNVVTELLGGATSGDFGSMFDIEQLKQLMGDMTITDRADGGKTIKIALPDISSITIETNKAGFPTLIRSGLVKVGNENLSATIVLNQKAKQMPSISTSGYMNFEVDQNTTKLITTFMNIINDGGVKLRGSLEVNGSSVCLIDCTIAKNLNTKISLSYNSVEASLYYINNNLYLNAFGNQIKISLADALAYFKRVFGVSLTSSTPKITMLNSTTIDVQDNKIALSVKGDKLINISVSGKNYSASLDAESTNQSFAFSDSGYSYMSVTTLTSLSNKIINASNQSQISLEFKGDLDGRPTTAYGYVQFLDNKTINQLCLIGDIKNNRFAIYFKDGYFYLNSDGALTKFSASAVDEFISYFSSIYSTSNFDLNELLDFFNQIKLSAVLKSENRLELNSSVGTINTYIYNNSIKISTDGVMIGGFRLSGDLKVNLASTYYKHYLNEFKAEYYTDLSDVTASTNAIAKSLKSGKTLRGNLRLSLDKILFIDTNIKLVDIKVYVKSIYKNGNLGLEIRLFNLPTNALITDYSNNKYCNHSAVVQIAGNSIKIKRTLEEKATGSTIVAVDKTLKLSYLSNENIADIFGISKSIIKKTSASATQNNFNFNALLNGITATDQTLSVNLQKAFKGLNMTQFDVFVANNNGLLSSIALNAKIGGFIGIKLTLS